MVFAPERELKIGWWQERHIQANLIASVNRVPEGLSQALSCASKSSEGFDKSERDSELTRNSLGKNPEVQG